MNNTTYRYSECHITEEDIAHAIRKWRGRDESQNICWKSNDKDFYENLSAHDGIIDRDFICLFSASNNDEKNRTGGYSFGRVLRGGAETWARKITEFRAQYVNPARQKFSNAELEKKIEIAICLHKKLCNMEGISYNGNTGKLGIVSSSKILFFMCPEFPFFIYDRVAGKGMDFHRGVKCEDYACWIKRCLALLDCDGRTAVEGHLPINCNAGWFKRRCLDLALYRCGSNHR